MKKTTYLSVLLTLAWLLAACAQVTPATPGLPTQPMETPSDGQASPYPYPASDQLGAAPTVEAVDPYPAVEEPLTASPTLSAEQRLSQKRLNTQFAPEAGDAKWALGPAYLDMDAEQLLTVTSDSTQVQFRLIGHVPNPCYQLRVVVHEPTPESQLVIEVYSVADPEKMCADMLQPFDETITLDNIPAGKYTVTINDQKWGSLEVK